MANEMWSCNCMGPQNGEPYCPCMMNRLGVVKHNGRWVEPEKDLGEVIEPIDTGTDKWDEKKMPFSQRVPCTSVEHNPPMGLYIPPGETYVHTCPACGEIKNISPPNITFSEIEDEDAFAAESDEEVKNSLKVQ